MNELMEGLKGYMSQAEDFVKKHKVLSGIMAGILLFLLFKKKD